MKLIIAGSREFKDYNLLKYECAEYIKQQVKQDEKIDVLCGLARGADLLGKKFAEENKYTILFYPAQWDVYGKSAGYRRNKEMAENATHLIAFWDGSSPGTKHMIDLARKSNLFINIVFI